MEENKNVLENEEKQTKEVKMDNAKRVIIVLFILLIVLSVIFIGIKFLCKNDKQEVINIDKDKIEEIDKVIEKIETDKTIEEEKEKEDKPEEENNEEFETVDITIEEENFAEEYVYTAQKETFKELFYGNLYTQYTSIMPQIKIEDERIEKINKEIESIYNTVQEYQESRFFISYGAYLNNEVLSLVVREDSVIFCGTDYYVYNINLNTNEVVTREEILTLKGITEEEIIQKTNIVISELKEQYKDELDYFAIREAKTNENEIFLDNNGDINVLIRCGVEGTDFFGDIYFPIK